jgi:segregation and condensation protein A
MTFETATHGTDGTNGSVDGRSAPPAVVFGEGRRPEATTTHVRMADFQGPLGLLLALIEARQLDVLTVPLGALADAYLDALASLDDDRLGNISAFVSVASQLILIKSRAMLPRQVELAPGTLPEEETDPEAELRARLILYRAHRDAGLRLQAEALLRHGLFRREPSAAAAAALAGARPSDAPPLDPAILGLALAGLVRIAPPVESPPEVVRRTITLTERAAFIREAILAAGANPIVLQELLRGVRDRVVVAVTFLAMLELMKRREIVVSQAAPWGPIVARATTAEERAVSGRPAPARVDEPLDESLGSFS